LSELVKSESRTGSENIRDKAVGWMMGFMILARACSH
jgi:hypothetical protein